MKQAHILFGVLVFIFSSFGIHSVFASTIVGTIPSNSYAWGENFGWINFGCTNCNVQVTDSAVTGDAWSAQYGWINLSPTNGGVTNDGNGNLSGQAWSSGLGWIPFSGVVINSSGIFTGVAGTQGSTAGRINFSCTNCSITTDWRPASVRNSQGSGGSSGGSSSGGGLLGGNSSVNSGSVTSTSSSIVVTSVASPSSGNPSPSNAPQTPSSSQHVTLSASGMSQDVLSGTRGWAYATSSTPHIVKKGIVTFENTASSSLFTKIGLNQLSSTTVYVASTSILIVVLLALFILRFI